MLPIVGAAYPRASAVTSGAAKKVWRLVAILEIGSWLRTGEYIDQMLATKRDETRMHRHSGRGRNGATRRPTDVRAFARRHKEQVERARRR